MLVSARIEPAVTGNCCWIAANYPVAAACKRAWHVP